MPVKVVICVPPSAARAWHRHRRPSFTVREIYPGQSLRELDDLDAVFVLFHLLDRLGAEGLAAAEGRSIVDDRRRPWLVASPRLSSAELADPRLTIERFVQEALAAVLAHAQAHGRDEVTLGFWHEDLGRGLDVGDRAAAIDAAIRGFWALLE